MFDFLDVFTGRRNSVATVRFETPSQRLIVVPTGDWHLGSNDCDIPKLKAHLAWLHANDCQVILMGDLLEFSTKDSVGAGWVDQRGNPQDQMDAVYEALAPVKDKVLLAVTGNHEERARKATGLDPTRILCQRLRIPYAGYSCFVYLRVGTQNYTLHVQHGASGAMYLRTKMQALMKTADAIDNVDVFMMGHVHELSTAAQIYRTYDKRTKTVVERTRQFVLTGHYLKFGGYAEMKNMAPGKSGSANITFSGDRHNIHVST